MVFGDGQLPIPLFGKANVDGGCQAAAAATVTGSVAGTEAGVRIREELIGSQLKGISITKVNRGERI